MTFRLSPGSSRCLVAPFVCCQDQRGAEVGLGGARMVPPMPGCPPPMLGAGAVGREGTDCCCLRGFCCNWGETLRSQLRVGARPGGLQSQGPSLSLSHKCYYAKAAGGSSAWREAMAPPAGLSPQHCPVGSPCAPWRERGSRYRPGVREFPAVTTKSMCWGGDGFGGEVENSPHPEPECCGRQLSCTGIAAGPVGAPRWGLILGGAPPLVFRALWLSDLTCVCVCVCFGVSSPS